MAAGLPTNLAGLANEIANIVGVNDWNIQEAVYNGATFHWVQPSYTGLNPVAGITDYVTSSLGGAPQKAPYGTFSNIMSISDSFKRKLCVYPVPNYEGYYVEDFGSTGSHINILGVVFGPNYLEVWQKCLAAFNDVKDPNVSPALSYGKISKENFRQFTHPIFGNANIADGSQTLPQVFCSSCDSITDSSKWRAIVFRLQLIAQSPSYLSIQSSPPSWQSQVQGYLNLAQNIIISISQAYQLINGVVSSLVGTERDSLGSLAGSIRDSMTLNSTSSGDTPLPIISGTGISVQSIVNEINVGLNNIVSLYQNSMAFFVQNSGGQIQSAYWSAIVLDYSDLPVYLTDSASFTHSDAQAVIGNYVDECNIFIAAATVNGYDVSLQNNIQAIKSSVVYLNNVARDYLAQNTPQTISTPLGQEDLYSVMDANGVSVDNFDKVNELNRGVWFSCLKIPAGTSVDLS